METFFVVLVVVLIAVALIWELSLRVRLVKLVIKFFRSLR